jgi:hypothetical protein
MVCVLKTSETSHGELLHLLRSDFGPPGPTPTHVALLGVSHADGEDACISDWLEGGRRRLGEAGKNKGKVCWEGDPR